MGGLISALKYPLLLLFSYDAVILLLVLLVVTFMLKLVAVVHFHSRYLADLTDLPSTVIQSHTNPARSSLTAP